MPQNFIRCGISFIHKGFQDFVKSGDLGVEIQKTGLLVGDDVAYDGNFSSGRGNV
jgi:hypothetical protein